MVKIYKWTVSYLDEYIPDEPFLEKLEIIFPYKSIETIKKEQSKYLYSLLKEVKIANNSFENDVIKYSDRMSSFTHLKREFCLDLIKSILEKKVYVKTRSRY